MFERRRTTATVAVSLFGVLVGVGLTGLLSGAGLRTPEQAVADAAPPPPSLVTADVSHRRLAERLVVRGRVVRGPAQRLHAPASGGGPTAVVTAIRKRVGDVIQHGDVVVEIAGRPLFALDGKFPAYRDLTGGMAGPDVRQLQEGLRRAGFPLEVDGHFGASTQAALASFCRSRGYPVSQGAPDADERVEQAQEAVKQARRAARAATRSGRNRQSVNDAWDAFADAADDLAKLRLVVGPSLPASEVVYFNFARNTATVGKVSVRLGDVLAPAAPLFDLGTRDVSVVVTAPSSAGHWLTVGHRARAIDDVARARYGMKIVSIRREGGSGDGYRVQLRALRVPLPATLTRSLRVVIRGNVASESVLSVPVTAVYARADGSSFVTVVDQSGGTRDVSVKPSLSVEGWVQVMPREASSLQAGDMVVVGIERRGELVDAFDSP